MPTLFHRFVPAAAFVGVVFSIAVTGCGPRIEVAKDKVLEQVDKVLGELNVKQKKIEMQWKELQDDMQVVREKKLNATVRVEQLTKKLESAKSDLEKIKAGLARVQPKLEEAKTKSEVDVNGKMIPSADLLKMADQLVDRAKRKQSEIDSLNTSFDALKRSAEFLETQEKAAAEMISTLEGKIAEINDRKVAIDAVRSATTLSGGDKSINDKINALGKEIDEMFVEVETSMRVEEAKLKDLQAQTITADELLLDSTNDVDATINEIDEILGKSGGN